MEMAGPANGAVLQRFVSLTVPKARTKRLSLCQRWVGSGSGCKADGGGAVVGRHGRPTPHFHAAWRAAVRVI